MIRWRTARAAGAAPPDSRSHYPVLTMLIAALAALAVLKLVLFGHDLSGRSSATAPTSLARAGPPAGQSTTLATLPEPAAGPGRSAGLDNAAGSAAPSPAATGALTGLQVPGPRPTRLDPDRLSASEIAVLLQLAERRDALDRRAAEIDRRAALLAIAEARLGEQIDRLSKLQAEIAAAIDGQDAKEEEKLRSLVKIYEAMKPKAAAEIFDRLEMPTLLQVVERMREPKSADVLARMDPAKAKQVTAELAKRSRPPGRPDEGEAAAARLPEMSAGG
jgi:flagellar motility protein MotE (MotC chaperone)